MRQKEYKIETMIKDVWTLYEYVSDIRDVWDMKEYFDRKGIYSRTYQHSRTLLYDSYATWLYNPQG
jgi:hypothetical protein